MEELHADQYHVATELIRPFEDHLALQALVFGGTEGRLFVDDASSPSCGYGVVRSRHFLLGRPRGQRDVDDAKEIIATGKPPQGNLTDRNWFTLFYGAEWGRHIGQVYNGIALTNGLRRYYELSDAVCADVKLPPGFELVSIDKVARMSDLENHESMMEEMASERASTDEFLNRSFGIALFQSGTIVGWCMSEYNLRDRCEIGIEIMPTHQRMGLGSLLAMAFMGHAKKKGVTRIGWHCRAENIPSNATAVKIGMRMVSEYHSCYGNFKM